VAEKNPHFVIFCWSLQQTQNINYIWARLVWLLNIKWVYLMMYRYVYTLACYVLELLW